MTMADRRPMCECGCGQPVLPLLPAVERLRAEGLSWTRVGWELGVGADSAKQAWRRRLTPPRFLVGHSSRKTRVRRKRGGVPHGTAGGYNNHGCRCDACRAAWTANTLRLRAERQESLRGAERPVRQGVPPKSEPVHGVASTYLNWGCRCEACKAAAREERKRSKRGR